MKNLINGLFLNIQLFAEGQDSSPGEVINTSETQENKNSEGKEQIDLNTQKNDKDSNDMFNKGFGKGKVKAKEELERELLNKFESNGIKVSNLEELFSNIPKFINKKNETTAKPETEFKNDLAYQEIKQKYDALKESVQVLTKEKEDLNSKTQKFMKEMTIKNALKNAIPYDKVTNSEYVLDILEKKFEFDVDDRGKTYVKTDKAEYLFDEGNELDLQGFLNKWLNKDENAIFLKSKVKVGSNLNGSNANSGKIIVNDMDEYRKLNANGDIDRNHHKYDISRI